MQSGFSIGLDPVGIHTGAEQCPPPDVEDKKTQRGGALPVKGSQWDRSAGLPDNPLCLVDNLDAVDVFVDQDRDPNRIDPASCVIEASSFVNDVFVGQDKDPNGIDPVQHPPPSPADGSGLPTQKGRGHPIKGNPTEKLWQKSSLAVDFRKRHVEQDLQKHCWLLDVLCVLLVLLELSVCAVLHDEAVALMVVCTLWDAHVLQRVCSGDSPERGDKGDKAHCLLASGLVFADLDKSVLLSVDCDCDGFDVVFHNSLNLDC